MACGSCAERARARQEAAAAAATGTAKTSQATYTVLAPDGSAKTFDHATFGANAYLEAQTYRRQVNGTLTTST